MKMIKCSVKFSGFLFLFIVIFYFHFTSNAYSEEKILSITHGIASGDVTKNGSTVWSKSNGNSLMNIKYDNSSYFSFNPQSRSIPVNESSDFTGHVRLENLSADTLYYYKIWFSDPNNSSIISGYYSGKFKTAPNEDARKDIHFIMAGDLGGSSLCRQEGIGYQIFSIMDMVSPDFFIFNGDQIYGDDECPNIPRSPLPLAIHPYWKNIKGEFKNPYDRSINWENLTQLHETYLKHWEYNRVDPHLQKLLSNTSMYSQSDDHEVINDYGGQWKNFSIADDEYDRNRKGYSNLVQVAMNLFFEFSPIDRNKSDPDRVYRSFNWGKYLDLYLLDSHSYRSLNNLADTKENNKTLYGREQVDWLKGKLLSSNSIWKVVSSPDPITVPNCFSGPTKLGNCDNWATNNKTKQTFVKERNEFLTFLDKNNIKNVVFIATDVHFAGTVRVDQDFDKDGDVYTFYELINGPLSTYSRDKTNPVDPTINARYLFNESAIFNFGDFKIQEDGKDKKPHLLYSVIDTNGRIRPQSNLDIAPE